MPYKSENKIAITQKTWSENNVWCAIVNTCRNNYFLPLSTDSRLIPKVMKAVAHMSLSNLWEKVWQYLDNSITLLSPILGPIHHWPSKKINSEGISTTLGYWFWEKKRDIGNYLPINPSRVCQKFSCLVLRHHLAKKKKKKNYPKDTFCKHWGVISTKVAFNTVYSSFCCRTAFQDWVCAKSKTKKAFWLVQSSASFIMRSGLESTYAIKEAWSNLTSKALFHTCIKFYSHWN